MNEEFLLLLVLMLVIELEVRHGESVLLGDRCCELSVTGYQLKGKIIKLEGEEQSLACLLAKAFGLGNLGRVRW